MRVLIAGLGILAAFCIQTVLSRHVSFLNGYYDLFLIVTAVFGWLWGRTAGLAVGTIAGLVQDTFSGGFLGFSGLAKTTVGFCAGLAGRHMILNGVGARVLFFVIVTLIDLVVLIGIGILMGFDRVYVAGLAPLYLCMGNALVGTISLKLIETNPVKRFIVVPTQGQ